jgi:hypothetical protein
MGSFFRDGSPGSFREGLGSFFRAPRGDTPGRRVRSAVDLDRAKVPRFRYRDIGGKWFRLLEMRRKAFDLGSFFPADWKVRGSREGAASIPGDELCGLCR